MEILLSIIFNPYFLIPTTLTSILPLRWVFRFWIFISIVGFGFSAFQTQESISHDRDIGYAFGIVLIITYGIFLSAIVMARLIIQKIRKTKLKTFPFETRVINIADTFLLFATGMVASIFIFKFIAFSLAAFPYGFIVHSVLIITSAVLMGTTLQFVVKNKKHSQLKILILTLALFCGLFLFSGLGIFYPYVVTRSAHNIAAGNSYCIGLNKRSRSLNSLEDLTLLTMDKSGFGHHAFLLVEKEDSTLEPYHWSYFQSKFLPRIINLT